MKFFTLIFTLLLSTQAFAHTDHALGEGAIHLLYHAVFWGLFAVVAVKVCFISKIRKSLSNKNIV